VGLPMPGPFSRTIFEDLQQRWSDIMLCIEPWLGRVWVERRFPFEAAVLLQFHAKQRVRETGEVVVVDACINERSWKINLSQDKYCFCLSGLMSNLPNVIFHCKLDTPQG